MEYRFKADEWTKLSPADRARRCRFMAREAQTLAKGASPAIALSYSKIAQDWLQLAEEIERSG
jgi:hypothetical protein